MKIPKIILKKLYIPLASIVIILLIGVFGGQYLWRQIYALRQELAAGYARESQLAQKLDLLEDFASNGLNIATAVSQALPAENSAVEFIMAARIKASQLGVVIENIGVGKAVFKEGSVGYADVNFDITGDSISALTFIEEISKASPLNSPVQVTMESAGDVPITAVSERVYFGQFPQTIGSSGDILAAISSEDQQILQTLIDLEPFEGIVLQPQPPNSNTNPFGI